MKLKFTIVALAAFAIFACSSCGQANKQKKNNVSEPIEGEMDTNAITEKYWKLITLEGQKVTMVENQEREVYFILKTDETKVIGFAGCNTFNGHYSLEKGNRIRFSQMATTMKACPDVAFNESEFFEVFEIADNYTINGDTLSLNVGRRAPLAVFEAVYF